MGLGWRVLRLFVDSVWLAVATLISAGAAGAAILAGAPRLVATCAMLAGLASVLAVSVRSAVRASAFRAGPMEPADKSTTI